MAYEDFIKQKQDTSFKNSTTGFEDFLAKKKESSFQQSSGGFEAFQSGQGLNLRKPDLNSVEGLTNLAEEAGLENQVNEILNKEPKLSFLQRVGKGLGAFNPGEAVATGLDEGVGAGLLQYPKSIATGLASAITGKDYEKDRRFFKDVVEKMGIENGVAKFGLGLIGDILLDPTTYFGGAIARGALKGTTLASSRALTTVGKVAPDIETGLRLAGKGAADAFGKAFVYGYGTSKGLSDDLLEITSKMDKSRLGIVQSNIERLGTGTLSPTQQEELVAKLVGGKLAEFTTGRATTAGRAAGKAAIQGGDPFVAEVAGQQAARSQKFAKLAGIPDPFEVYFPYIKKDKIGKFLEGTKTLKVGSEGYRKQFRNILTDEQIINDPVEAFARTEWNIAKDSIVRDELSHLVKEYGVGTEAFKSIDEATAAGYTAVKEKGIFGKVVGYLKEGDKRFIDSMITPEFTTIDKLAKATGFDAITALFKRSVTGLFLPFHVRNYTSGVIQNFEVLGKDALNPANISAGNKLAWKIAKGEDFVDEIVTQGGQQVNVGKAMNAFIKRFGGDSSYVKDIADLTSDAGVSFGKTRLTPSAISKVNPLSADNVVFRKARGIGQFIEHQQKGTAYITALKQGKTIDEALRLATAAGFDYRALTPFEAKFMRRIIPFYSFTRKNIELQLKTMGEHPERINQILAVMGNAPSLFGGDKATDEENKFLPDYLKNSLGIKLADTPEGIAQYISNFGTPVEAFADLINGNPVLKGISMMNPLIKAPTELGIGKDSFRQKDLKDVYSAKEYSAAPKVLKDLLDIKAVERPVLEEGPDGKLREVGTRVEYVADPQKLLIARSLFTSRGFTYLDEIFDGDLQGLLKALKLTTGLKIQQIDVERNKGIEESRQKQALKELLDRYGEASIAEILYQPKDQEAQGILPEEEN